MAIISEGKHTGEYVVSETTLSKDKGTLASGQNLDVGAVIGNVLTGTATADAGNTGNGTAGAVTIGSSVVEGTYTLTCTAAATNAGIFKVITPDGFRLNDLTVAVAYTSPHINLTIADGATDFIVGDVFTVVVASGNYTEYNPVGTNGSQIPTGILYGAVDATDAATSCVVTKRYSEVRDSDLTWITGATTDQKTAAKKVLAKAGIIAR